MNEDLAHSFEFFVILIWSNFKSGQKIDQILISQRLILPKSVINRL